MNSAEQVIMKFCVLSLELSMHQIEFQSHSIVKDTLEGTWKDHIRYCSIYVQRTAS